MFSLIKVCASTTRSTGKILVKLNDGDCTIIPYPTVEEKHT